MIYISESESAAIVSHALAYEASKTALIAACAPDSTIFPVVLGHGSKPENRFTIKAASGAELAGLKVGAYFPTNDARGLPRHASTILLIDQNTGRIGALVEGSAVNCYRTAAADAVATDTLARPDASVLALFGTGHQAVYEAEAIARIRSLTRVLVVGRDPAHAERFVEKLRLKDLPVELAGAEAACSAANIIVTATTATAPLFQASWVRSGTHVSTMGSDSTGKQELPPELFLRAKLFCDLPAQSRRIGEFQHLSKPVKLTAIGDVLSGKSIGRVSPEDITIFDSSGLSIQDLYIAQSIIGASCSGNAVATVC